MLDNLADHHPILHETADLLRNRTFLVVVLALQNQIDARALAREDFCVQALAQVESRSVHLVKHHGREGPVNLQLELGRPDDVDGGDECVYDEGKRGAVVDGNSVAFAVYLDDGLVAAGYQDGVGLLGGDFNNFAPSVVEVLDVPFLSFELYPRGLPGAHGVGFGAFGGAGRFAGGCAALGDGALEGDCGAGA